MKQQKLFKIRYKQIKIDIMKNKLQQKIYAMFQRTIQFTLHIFSKLCVSLSTTTENNLCENEKIGKFDEKYIFYNGEKIILFNINNMTEEEKKEKEIFISTFNDFVEKKSKDIWLTPDKISEVTGSTQNVVIKYVESFDEFVKNSEGKYTTKIEYFKYTPFVKRFKDLLNGTIE